MEDLIQQNRTCKICNSPISTRNKSGYCKICYQKYGMKGENNPFYGKKHSHTTIQRLKEKCKIASEEKWKDQQYRKNVLDSIIGLKRTDEFKKQQSERVKIQMKNPEQRKLRSQAMKLSWKNGNIIHTPNISINSSKQEKEFFGLLVQKYNKIKQKQVILYKDEITHRKKHLFPDGFIEELNTIIEFHGSFWHADIRLFPSDDIIVHHGITAKECRENNENKKQLYKHLGYEYIEIWSYDFLNDKEKCVNNTLEKIKIIEENKKLL